MRVVRFLGESEKVRKVVVIEHCSPAIPYFVHNSCITNAERAVKERIFFVEINKEWTLPPLPIDSHFEDTLRVFLRCIRKYLPHAAPVERNKFADLYTGRKREIYRLAASSLYDRDIDDTDTHVKAFVKAEKTNKPDSAPRLIQPRTTRYGVELGRYLKPLEKRIGTAINNSFNRETVTVFKGLNASDAGQELFKKWRRFRRPIALGLDAKRFDQHMHTQALKWEHSVYVSCFNNKRHKLQLKKLLKHQLRTIGRIYCKDGKIKYSKVGGRCSGDMNTGLGLPSHVCSGIFLCFRIRCANRISQ